MVQNFESSPRLLVPEDVPCSDDDKDEVGCEIKKFYFGDKPISMDTVLELITVLGDTMFSYAAVRSARIHASWGSPVYFYVYDRPEETQVSVFEKLDIKIPACVQIDKIAGHGADGRYFWTNKMFFNEIDPETKDGHMVKKINGIVANFMKTGQPTLSDGQPLDVTWPTFRPHEESYLHIIDDGFKIEKRPFKERVDFWDRLYQRYGQL